MRAHCRPGQSSEFARSGRSVGRSGVKSQSCGSLRDRTSERPSRGGTREGGRERRNRRNSEVVNFTCVCTGRAAIERSFSHRESFSAVIFGSLPHSLPFDTSFLPRSQSRNITLSRHFPSTPTDRPTDRLSYSSPKWTARRVAAAAALKNGGNSCFSLAPRFRKVSF